MKKLLLILSLFAVTLLFSPSASARPHDGRHYRKHHDRGNHYGHYRGGRGEGYYSRREYQGRRRYYRGGRYYYRTRSNGYYPYGYRNGGRPGVRISF